jgi:ABC-type transport system involved in multi-copper enzyme maturation permease subunit
LSAKTTDKTAIAADARPSPFTGFLAILYYEFLWNIRKKKTIGVFLIIFLIATLQLALPPILANYSGATLQPNPTYVIDQATTFSGIFMFLLAVAVSMNSISGEFETGTIVPLLTKPVSRTTVFLGKVAAAFLTLLAAFSFFAVYFTIGGILVRGPQDNLELLPLGMVGLTIATMVWVSIVLALGSLSKSSLVAALGSFGVFLAVTIVTQVVAVFLGQSNFLFYTPGDGATASTGECSVAGEFGNPQVFATGTNELGNLLVRWVLYGSQVVNFCGIRIRVTGTSTPEFFRASADTIAGVATRDLAISIVYIAVLLFVSWFAFWKAQIKE